MFTQTVYNYWLLSARDRMDDYEEAIVAFSQGLVTNPKENAMLTALVETMLKSSLKGKHEISVQTHFSTICNMILAQTIYSLINTNSAVWLITIQ